MRLHSGRGGCIAMDPRGNISAAFTTTGMFRGWIDTNGKMTVRIYAEPVDSKAAH
jgi:isoaspartyl peptidase/L-asparaginase-like protein (Ntn-hydrolase superfamily)